MNNMVTENIVSELRNLSVDDLMKLKKEIDKIISNVSERKKKEALNAVQKLAANYGYDLDELVSAERNAKVPKNTPTKAYIHPDDQTLTWSGRGRHPRWFRDLLRRGFSPEELLKKSDVE